MEKTAQPLKSKPIRVALKSIHAAVKNRPAGYLEHVLSVGTLEGGSHVLFEPSVYKSLKDRYSPGHDGTRVPPTMSQKVAAVIHSMAIWAKRGFKVVTKEVLEQRTAICHSCELWDPNGFAGTGSCRRCGCSTKSKLVLAHEKCPVGKWLASEDGVHPGCTSCKNNSLLSLMEEDKNKQ